MLIVRSIAFNVLFYLNLLALMVAALPTLAMPRIAILAMARLWARSSLWLLRAVCGIEVEFRGVEKIPAGGQFYDGRAADLLAQFEGPLLDPLEMNAPSRRFAVEAIRDGAYAPLAREVYGEKVFDDPDWQFEYFGVPGRSLGGLETFGSRRVLQDEVGYSEVINGEKVMKSREPVVIP